MRLKSELWVKAYLRQCSMDSIGVYVTRRGDSDAGIILIKVDCLNGSYRIYGPAIGTAFSENGDRLWRCLTVGQESDEHTIDAVIAKQISFDSDIWVISVEDRHGNALLGDAIVEDN